MAPTVLNPGDVAVVGYISNSFPDSFSFVPLVPLNAGTVICFTDSGWAGTSFRDTEGIIKFFVNNDIAAGTVINSSETSNDFTWNNFSRSLNLSTSGDQITVLQSNNLNSPLSSDFTAIYQIDNTGFFEDAFTAGTGSVVTGLSEADNTAVLFNEPTSTYAAFDFYTIPNGTREDWLRAIKNPENWTFASEGKLTITNIEVIPEVSNAPIISLSSDKENYTENSAIALDADATIFDFDSFDFDKGKLTVRLTEGGSADDRLSIRNLNDENLRINASNNSILLNGSFVGTYIGGKGKTALEITFTSKASLQAVQIITNNITYENVSDNPSTKNRQVEFVLTDGDGETSEAVSKIIEVTAVDDSPTIGNNVLLYNGSTGKSPENAWFTYQDTTAYLGGSASETPQKDGIRLKTDDTAYAGYTNHEVVVGFQPQLNPRANFPVLDRNSGYVVSFTSQIISESHDNPNADKNGDGIADRAGFSVIAISEDKKGIELGFWENRIWVQEDGTDEPTNSNPEGTLFTQAEGVDFDTKTKVVKYDLAVKGDRYTLLADGNAILEGELRDYTDFKAADYRIFGIPVTPPDPYEKPSFLFFGDNTPAAEAEVKLSDISITTNSDKPSFFKVDENAVYGTFVGKVIATDPDSTTLSNWEILEGNLDLDGDGKDAFAINSKTGKIIVRDADDIDFETNPSFQLKVSVSDGNNTSLPQTVTINLNDVTGSQIDAISKNERLKGSAENDTINGKAGKNYLYGKGGNDTLVGGTGSDNLYGGEGNDSLDGGKGNDFVREKADVNFVLTDSQLTGRGTDTLTNIERAALTGGESNNKIDASAYTKTAYLYGRDGNDTLLGGSGNDNLYGGEGNDSLDGGAGNDFVREKADVNFTLSDNQLTGRGTDTLINIEKAGIVGGESANIIDASAYTKTTYLYGRNGNDTLLGGSGSDNLYGGAGNDSLDGGEGKDFVREKADTNFVLTDSQLTGMGSDTLINIEVAAIQGGASANTIDASAYTKTTYLYGEGGNDTLVGGSGRDNLYGGAGNDSLDGGKGFDFVREKADVNFTLTNQQLTGVGTDTLTSIEGAALTGGASANKFDASAYTKFAYLYGKGGNDTLLGGSNNDLLKGGTGNDLINGGAGNDRLYGEAGNDTFVITSVKGTDTIFDFEDGVDSLGLSGDLSFGSLTIQADGNNTNILEGDNVLATLVNVNSSLINESDFTIL